MTNDNSARVIEAQQSHRSSRLNAEPDRTPSRKSVFLASLLAIGSVLTSSCGGGAAADGADGLPAASDYRVLVPAYFTAGAGDARWPTLIDGLQRFPNVAITAILNPTNGIFNAPQPGLRAAAAEFASKGGKVIGYVMTDYGSGARSLADIKAGIDAYATHYGNSVSGIFLDEMFHRTSRIGFYQAIVDHIRTHYPAFVIVGNPGAHPDAAYFDLVDVMVSFEGLASDYLGVDAQTLQTWQQEPGNGREALLVHSASCADMQDAIRAGAAAHPNARIVYFTDLHYDPQTYSGDPWVDLPGYWAQLLGTVNAVNSGLPAPAC